MNRKLICLIWIGLLLVASINAQLLVSGEFRPRFEVRDGYKTLLNKSQNPAFVTSQRSRLNLEYQKESLTFYLSLQDARVWGESVYKADNPSFGLNEAWMRYLFSDFWSLKLGRQVLAYDDSHLLGPNNWGNVGASHDVAILRFVKNDLKMDVGMAFNNNTEKLYESNYPLNYYKYLGFLWINKALNDDFSLSLLTIADGNQEADSHTAVHSRFTSGFFFSQTNTTSLFGLNLSAYYQYGKNPAGKSVSAYLISLYPKVRLSKKLELSPGLDYFSGNDAFENNEKDQAFSNLYGDGHGLYGYMDYFSNIPKDTKGSGLTDIFLRCSFKPSAKTGFEFTVHNFSLTANAIDSISIQGSLLKAERKLGTELDLVFKHKLKPDVDLNVGYSTMLASESLELLKGGDHSKYQQWFWIMIVFKPILYKQESVGVINHRN